MRQRLLILSIALLWLTGCTSWRIIAIPMPPLPDSEGFAGGFVGVSHGGIVFAGGSNFPERPPWEGGSKHYYNGVYSLRDGKWTSAGALPFPISYGASVNDGDSIICIGGTVLDDLSYNSDVVFRLEWVDGQTHVTRLPRLPVPRTFVCAAIVGRWLYVAGGSIRPPGPVLDRWYAYGPQAEIDVYRLDLATSDAKWETIEPLPGPSRILATAASCDGALWIFGGATFDHDGRSQTRHYLSDAYRYDPGKGWSRVADLPTPMAASPSPAPVVGHSIFILGGDDGADVNTPPAQHPGFNRHVLRYDSLHNRWLDAGLLPVAQVTTPAVPTDDGWIICSGEIRPGIRTPAVWRIRIAK